MVLRIGLFLSILCFFLASITYARIPIVGKITQAQGAPLGHGLVSIHHGYLAIVFSKDSGKGDGGFAFYDISNPSRPQLVNRRYDSETYPLREAHGYGYFFTDSKQYVALQAINGIQFWDWSNVRSPKLLKYLKLPGIERSDYAKGAWWAFWQAPYVYVGGSGNGLYIIDASDPANPFLAERKGANPIPISQIGGFRVGPVYAIGNLMVLTSMDQAGYATLDISDPLNPELLHSRIENMPKVYSALVTDNKIYGAGSDSKLYIHDISDPKFFKALGSVPIGGKGGYLTYQDGFAHVGSSRNYTKVDVRSPHTYRVVGEASSGKSGRDEDFATVVGDLVFIGDDHGNGTYIARHQDFKDGLGPKVNMIYPKKGDTEVDIKTRIGMSFSDQVDLLSVNEGSFIVQEKESKKRIYGRFSGQQGIINFAPNDKLKEATTYEIILLKGGVKDISGNPLEEDYMSYFTTSHMSPTPFGCQLKTLSPAVTGSFANFSINVLSGESYRIEFGDGSSSDWTSQEKISHKYQKSGHYTVILERKSPSGINRCSRTQIVYNALTSSSPQRSRGMIYVEDSKDLWTVNPDNFTVTAINTITFKKKFEVIIGKNPSSLAVAPDGLIWVVVKDEDKLAVLSPRDGSIVFEVKLPYGSRPHGIIFSHASAYVSLEGAGKIAKISWERKFLDKLIDVGPSPRGLALDSARKNLFVTRFISPNSSGRVGVIDVERDELKTVLDLSYDNGEDREDSGRGVPNYLNSITISPDGTYALIPSKKDNISRGQSRDGLPLNFENTVRSIVSHIDLKNGVKKDTLSKRIDINDRALPFVVEFSKLGNMFFLAHLSSNTVEVFDSYSKNLITSIEESGDAPIDLVFNDSGNRLFIHNFLSREVAIFDVGQVVNFEDNKILKLATISLVDLDNLSSQELKGKKIFYNARDERMSRDGYISCAVCHVEGGQDGRVWDFTDRGEGLRNTTTLIGKSGTKHGRLHWSGNFDEIQDFEHDIRNAFGGKGFLADHLFYSNQRNHPLQGKKQGLSFGLDALSAYVSSLSDNLKSPYRRQDGQMTEMAIAGEKTFEKLKCTSCHVGEERTDSNRSARHDVGTWLQTSGQRLGGNLDGFDTPTLNSIWATAPYLHDGRFNSITDLIEHFNQEHGSVKNLTQQEKKELTSYLLQLEGPIKEVAGPLVMNLNSRGKKLELDKFGIRKIYYTDRDYYFKNTPSILNDGWLIKTANDDKDKKAQYFSFQLARTATVYVLYDSRASRLPAWLSYWSQTPFVVETSDVKLIVYEKKYDAGEVKLYGNADSPMKGARSNFVVVVKEQ